MRGIERLLAAILLAGAVAGAAAFPRFLGSSGTVSAPELGLRAPTPATVVEAAPLPTAAPLVFRPRLLLLRRVPAASKLVSKPKPVQAAVLPAPVAVPTAPKAQTPAPAPAPAPAAPTPAPTAPVAAPAAPVQLATVSAPAPLPAVVSVEPAKEHGHANDNGQANDNGNGHDGHGHVVAVSVPEAPLAVTPPAPGDPGPVVQPPSPTLPGPTLPAAGDWEHPDVQDSQGGGGNN